MYLYAEDAVLYLQTCYFQLEVLYPVSMFGAVFDYECDIVK